MGNDPFDPKGKNKAEAESDSGGNQFEASATSEKASPSMTARIVDSASALSKDMFSGPPGTASLAAFASGEKSHPSGSQRGQGSVGESSVQHRPKELPRSSFEPCHTREHVARQEAAFTDFLDSTNVFMPTAAGGMESTWHASTLSGHGSQGSATGGLVLAPSSIVEQESRDGQDVVALLSVPDEDPTDLPRDDAVSPEDRDGLRRALFGDLDKSGSVAISPSVWDDVLNFVPAYLQAGDLDGMQTYETRMHFGTADAHEASRAWISQWSQVLSRYQDEVWGDLGSLVEEARSEVRELGKAPGDGPPPGPKSLLRLRAILGHLRGP